jgi:alkylation response protein AidB-like acyl-CoA dehydrogenase
LAKVQVSSQLPNDRAASVDSGRVRRIWHVLSAADLTSIALGMADVLCRRALAHAAGRVQFPGLFHDEQSRDTIGKFGAVKQMIAEIAAGRYAIETLDHTLSPLDFSASSVERAGLIKAIVAETLGTSPGSLSYNAGQIFGGTGYSEDDVLAKLYRDAAAWRFLGAASRAVFLNHGEALLRGWRPDGHRLASVTGEAELFDDLAQRKALQGELDEIRVIRSRLRTLVADWLAPPTAPSTPHGNTGVAEITELLGRQDALLLASKALLLRTHARLEHGLPAEIETVLVRIWLNRALQSLDDLDNRVKVYLAGSVSLSDTSSPEPGGAPVIQYPDFLAAPNPYESGDFLCKPFDFSQPRYVPEMNEADADLARRDREMRALFQEQLGQPRDGLPFERYIESRHRPDAADLDFCRKHGFFRMPIPTSLGGEGRRKVDYYLLTTNAQRLADVAISLTIQANTSIGTTPALLARDKDIPRALKDLGPFVGDPTLQHEIGSRLDQLLKLFDSPNPRRIEKAYLDLQKRLEETVFSRSALKSLAHRFVASWQRAGRAGLGVDPAGMRAGVEEAMAAWKETCAQAPELHGELARRREACDLFLRWVAAGQISAFALTEPSAGSDTARVATRARLRSVPVDTGNDGLFRFVPEGAKQPRYLIDARRLEFRGEGIYYRWSAEAEPAPVCFDEYDYETDDPHKLRFYEKGGRRLHFNDIAQLRERDGRLWYDYYELTGAKMWITNGRMCGIMCLYAKTEQGVTGFIVDRHAEGLIVGKDEDKLGQCGSPTNELSLQAVRVPRENVLGLEGRGQVNALETLNVGRAGLAMSAMAQMAGLIDASRSFALARHRNIPDWAAWRLQRMEEDRFTAEALAHDVIGRFEHPQTRSARMESAISKMLVSELLHRVIETAEEIHELPGQTTEHLVEKRKRDARVLNIYEGTNEVQRFSILKDLAAEVAPRWKTLPGTIRPPSRNAQELEALKANARQRVDAALDLFGQDVWQNPNLQTDCFLLAEAVAWLAAAESTLARLSWLARRNEAGAVSLQIGQGALDRCFAETRLRLRRFDDAMPRLRHGHYAPEIRAAALLFDQLAEPKLRPPLQSSVSRPFSILVIVEPSAAEVPHPYVAGGRLLEPHFSLRGSDRSALETALRIRDQATASVSVAVAAVGPPAMGQTLREILSLGVDHVYLLSPDVLAVPPDRGAAALADVLGCIGRQDLILGGSGESTCEDGRLARLTGEALGAAAVGHAVDLAVDAAHHDGTVLLLGADRRQEHVRALPATVLMEAGVPLRSFTTREYLAGLKKDVEALRWPETIDCPQISFIDREPEPAVAGEEDRPHALRPGEAGTWVLREAGLGGTGDGHELLFAGPIQDVDDPGFLLRRSSQSDAAPGARPDKETLLVLATDSADRLGPEAERVIRAGHLATQLQGRAGAGVVVLVTGAGEKGQRGALARLERMFHGEVVLLPVPGGKVSDDVRTRLLVERLGRLPATFPVIVGEPWTEPAFARLVGRSRGADATVAPVVSVGAAGGRLILETSRAHGKLRLRQVRELSPGTRCWISLAENAEVTPGRPFAAPSSLQVERWASPLPGFYEREDMQRLLGELRQEAGVARLADAEFIVDVGFGVGNRDGYEEVIEPLERALRDLGVQSLVIGGSRKVTEELRLLPADRQIGQSGVSVNPRVMLAIGISGAPQHLSYIGPRAKILAFNRDPEAPLMTLNQRQPLPRVYPVVGDLFETVPALVAALQRERETVSQAR